MQKIKHLFLCIVLLSGSLLSGCAAVVVGGIATGVTVTHDRRSPETFLNDKEIQLNAYRILASNSDINNGSRISVSSYNHRVLLLGTTTTAEAAQRFAQLIAESPKVSKVHNELSVAPPSLPVNLNDSYLTSKAKLALFNIDLEDFDPSRVKIVTSSGRIYLMGILTEQEAQAVVEKVRFIHGVKRVIKLFDYYQPQNEQQ